MPEPRMGVSVPADVLGRILTQLDKLERQTPVSHDKPVIIRPLRRAFSMVGVGRTRGHQLIKEGVLEAVAIGKRGKGITLASIERFSGGRG
jgi:hypothetical protein